MIEDTIFDVFMRNKEPFGVYNRRLYTLCEQQSHFSGYFNDKLYNFKDACALQFWQQDVLGKEQSHVDAYYLSGQIENTSERKSIDQHFFTEVLPNYTLGTVSQTIGTPSIGSCERLSDVLCNNFVHIDGRCYILWESHQEGDFSYGDKHLSLFDWCDLSYVCYSFEQFLDKHIAHSIQHFFKHEVVERGSSTIDQATKKDKVMSLFSMQKSEDVFQLSKHIEPFVVHKIYKGNDYYIPFERCSVTFDVSFLDGKIMLHKEPYVSYMPYDHFFVWNTGRICVGKLDYNDIGCSLGTYVPLDIGAQSIWKGFDKVEQILTTGYRGNEIVPVKDFSLFIDRSLGSFEFVAQSHLLKKKVDVSRVFRQD